MSILIRKVSIDCFYENCKNGCPFFEEDSNKHKYYCHLDKTRKWFWNSWKKRILFSNFTINYKHITNTCIKYQYICNKIHNIEQSKLNQNLTDFGQGFSDCMNGLPVQKNDKSYIEGYSKAMMLKKDCDGKKFTNNVLTNNNNNNGLTNSNATTSSTTTIIT